MKHIKLKSPQVIEVESTHTSNIKDALLECKTLCKSYDIDIDFNFNGFLFKIDRNSDLNKMIEAYNFWLNNLK